MDPVYHVELSNGGVFSGQHATLWDLSEGELEARVLDLRAASRDLWVEGKPFEWASTTARIYEGSSTQEIPDFSKLLGPGAYAVTGLLTEVTDSFISGPPGPVRDPNEEPAPPVDATVGSTVFVVHGANVAWREEAARFLEQILDGALTVTVLHEQSNASQTVMEKLERAAAAARYAVVLLTGDDEGRRRGDDQLDPRARQNVIFEMGYFFAILGRHNVCVLHEAGVELPSDISGVVYVALDEAGGWKLKLYKELKAAGIEARLD